MNYTLAIPSNKRMEEDSLKCLKEAGLTITRHGRDLKGSCVERADIIPVFIDYKDIAIFVGRGDIDFGITTSAALQEHKSPANTVEKLDFSHCRLVFAANEPVPDIQSWYGQRIAAKYPVLATEFFKNNGRNDIEILPVSGSTEIYPIIGLVQGIVDIAQSGASLRENGLFEVAELMPVQAVFIQNPHLKSNTLGFKLF